LSKLAHNFIFGETRDSCKVKAEHQKFIALIEIMKVVSDCVLDHEIYGRGVYKLQDTLAIVEVNLPGVQDLG
jgi:hypothetical protein